MLLTEQPPTAVAKPFLKWAGGKTQLLGQLRAHYPTELDRGGITNYVEPFVGGGAAFLDIMQRNPVYEAHLSDINPELIVAYTAVQRDPQGLIDRLTACRQQFLERDDNGRTEFFYDRREQYNTQKTSFDFDVFSEAWAERAASLIFLNKTCFNGLFRVNASGHFNVSFGRYVQPEIFDAGNILAVSHLLQRATIRCESFERCRPQVDNRTFVYFDPPYRPISATSNFTSYTVDRFDDTDQRQLAGFFADLDASCDARLMLTNSDPKNVNPKDNFFDDLYAGFTVRRVMANRMINSASDKRGKITDILVTNYSNYAQENLWFGNR